MGADRPPLILLICPDQSPTLRRRLLPPPSWSALHNQVCADMDYCCACWVFCAWFWGAGAAGAVGACCTTTVGFRIEFTLDSTVVILLSSGESFLIPFEFTIPNTVPVMPLTVPVAPRTIEMIVVLSMICSFSPGIIAWP
jgi:hypothetical protein